MWETEFHTHIPKKLYFTSVLLVLLPVFLKTSHLNSNSCDNFVEAEMMIKTKWLHTVLVTPSLM
jgi:hypothetical protein